jgi:molecular chaperone DnaK
MEGENVEAIKSKTEALTQAAMKLGEAVYKASQAEAEGAEPQAQPEAGKKTGTDDSTVVDADYEEVDPDKKQ